MNLIFLFRGASLWASSRGREMPALPGFGMSPWNEPFPRGGTHIFCLFPLNLPSAQACRAGVLAGGRRPTSPQGPLCHDLAFVCHQTKAPVSLLALQRLRAVRLCIRSALQIDTIKLKKKWLINPWRLTCAAGLLCTSACSPQCGLGG